jgi:hypothetical protein
VFLPSKKSLQILAGQDRSPNLPSGGNIRQDLSVRLFFVPVAVFVVPIATAIRRLERRLKFDKDLAIAQKISLARSRSQCDTGEPTRTGVFVVTP